MRPPNLRLKLVQTGFGLVEIMVALVIGLVVTLVITQVLSVFEGQKRSTSGTADAQTNGSLALYALQREVQMAGFALPLFDTGNTPLNCTTFTPAPPAVTDISPVTIVDGGGAAGASDSVTVRYGDSQFAGTPVAMVSGTAGAVAQVATTMACQVISAPGNDALVVKGTACSLTKVNAFQVAGPPTITLVSSANVEKDSKLSCLGTWRQVAFSVNAANQMERREMVAGVADAVMPVGSEIVLIKAQYGISTTADNNTVVQWVNATNTNPNEASDWRSSSLSVTPALRNRIKAIRVAVVARNSLLEKEAVTSACSSTTTAAPTGLCAWDATTANPVIASPAPRIDLSNDFDWQRYRYRVFETIIPLRNMIWSKEVL